ncbi:unnamed protein product [Linum trigynum]|uniref:KIB1-4 beta-propeller domain-containing protein n=1 Tax=Linum trigynum TaxID=586398 RepID=A0AAV2GB21_9ROSI
MDYSELVSDVLEKIVTEHVHTFSQLVAFSGVCKSWRTAALPLRHRRPLSMQLPGLLISQAAAVPSKSPAASRYCGPPHDFVPLTTIQQPTSPPSPSRQPAEETRSSTKRRRRLPHVTLPHFPSRSKVSHIIRESVRLHWGDDIYLDDDPYLGSTIQAKHYVASNDGWILIMQHQHVLSPISFYLLNPITKSSIPLPPLPFPANPTHILKGAISSSPDQDDDEEEDCHVFLLFRSRPQLAWCNV